MGLFKIAVLIKQRNRYCIVLTLRIVLKALTFLALDENIERRQLLLHMCDGVGKKFINADDVMMAASDRIMTSRYHRLHWQVEV